MTTAATTTGRSAPPARADTIRATVPLFYRHLSPVVLTVATALTLGARFAVGGWALGDLWILLAVLALQPLVEWLIHVYVLHARPVTVAGRTIDLHVARKHRRHHADPRNLEIITIPTSSLLSALVGVVALGAVLPDWPRRLSLAAVVATGLLVYEWTHFLIHTDYKPRTALYRRLYEGHRLHHFRNENYWFGVTRRFGDTVLRTNPSKDAVPVSPTARNLLALGD